MRAVQTAFNQFRDDWGLVYIDVGAYCGGYVKQCLKRFENAHVLAVEPCPKNFKVLKSKYGNNPRVALCNFMVGRTDGRETFYCTDIKGLNGSSESNTIFGDVLKKKKKHRKNMGGIKTREVACTTMDSLLAMNDLDRVDIVKLNCEGGEYEIFEAETVDWLDVTSYIAIDLHSDNSFYHTDEFIQKRRRIYDVLKNHGFVVMSGEAKAESKEDVSLLMKRMP